MTDMLMPLLDHSKPENIERFNDFCKVFFKEYNKTCKGYISKKDLKKPLNEITTHFTENAFGYYKLKILFSLLESGDNKIKELNELIDTLNTPNISDGGLSNVIKILDKDGDNKISFEEFKEIVKLLLFCLIDQTTEQEADDNKDEFIEIIYIPDENFNEIHIKFDEILSLDDESVSIEQFVCDLVDDILLEFSDIVNPIELKETILNILQDVTIEKEPVKIKEENINELYFKYNIDPIHNISRNEAEQMLYIFLTDLIEGTSKV